MSEQNWMKTFLTKIQYLKPSNLVIYILSIQFVTFVHFIYTLLYSFVTNKFTIPTHHAQPPGHLLDGVLVSVGAEAEQPGQQGGGLGGEGVAGQGGPVVGELCQAVHTVRPCSECSQYIVLTAIIMSIVTDILHDASWPGPRVRRLLPRSQPGRGGGPVPQHPAQPAGVIAGEPAAWPFRLGLMAVNIY